METRRLVLAMLLSAMILIVWNSFFPPVPPPSQPADRGPVDESVGEDRISEDRDAEDPAAPQREAEGSDSASGEPDAIGSLPELEEQTEIDFGEEAVAEMEETLVLENDRVRLELSNRGAQLVSARLKDYQAEEGETLEMVRDRGSDPYPFALVVMALFVFTAARLRPVAAARQPILVEAG